jgi:hypothetical protein
MTFKHIFIISRTPDQPLYQRIKGNSQIEFITLNELDNIVHERRDILIIFDDIMQEARNSTTIANLHTRGRHQGISVISLEQDLFYSNHVERRNVDYFILTKLRDTSCLNEFYKRFCQDIQQWRFITLYEFTMEEPFGFLIIDFISHNYKYRINSLNTYFCLASQVLDYIHESDVEALKQLNNRLQNKFSQGFNPTKPVFMKYNDKKYTHLKQKDCGKACGGCCESNDDDDDSY